MIPYQTLDHTSPSLGALIVIPVHHLLQDTQPLSVHPILQPVQIIQFCLFRRFILMFNSFNKSRSSFSNCTISNHGFSATDISVGNSSPITEEASDDYVSPASALISTASDFGSRSAADLLSTSDVSPQQSPVAFTGVISPGSSATGSFSSPVKNQLMVMSHQSDLHYQIVTV